MGENHAKLGAISYDLRLRSPLFLELIEMSKFGQR